jgi:hypothetical protein
VRHFDKGWVIGHETHGSGAKTSSTSLIHCGAHDCNTYGYFVGHETRNTSLWGCWAEDITNATDDAIGLAIRNECESVALQNSLFAGCDVGVELGTSTSQGTNGAYSNVLIEHTIFNNIQQYGIRKYSGQNSSQTVIRDCKFNDGSGGTATGIDLEDVAHRGLLISNCDIDDGLATDISNKDRTNQYDVLGYSGGFINQLSRLSRGRILGITAGNTTPGVQLGYKFKTQNTGATKITDLNNGYEGQEIIILIDDTWTSFAIVEGTGTGTNLHCPGQAGDFTCSQYSIVRATCLDGTKWLLEYSEN